MAFISNKEREQRVKRSNQSYGLRKAFIAATVASLIVLVVFAIIIIVSHVSLIAKYQTMGSQSAHDLIRDMADPSKVLLPLITCNELSDGGFETALSPFGWFLSIWALLTLGLSIVSLILMLNMKSPKAAKENINILQESALSGKKLKAHANVSQVLRDRASSPKEEQKKEKKK